MDFDDSPEEAAFRQECRTWLAANAKLRTPGIAEVWRTLRPRDEGEDDASLLVGKRWQALKADIEAFVAEGLDCVIDVGCAEGYYAVGLARLFPAAKVFASEMCGRVVDRVVQIYGGAGYLAEYDAEDVAGTLTLNAPVVADGAGQRHAPPPASAARMSDPGSAHGATA